MTLNDIQNKIELAMLDESISDDKFQMMIEWGESLSLLYLQRMVKTRRWYILN